MKFMTTGGDRLKKNPDFKLVGREEELKLLTSILMRSKAASVILVGPGGVGATALAMGLQASKDDPNSPFDIISKRFFWLDYDELFSSGKPDEMNQSFQKILAILRRTPDSVLMIEDARDFIDTAKSQGCGHFINALNSAVKNGDTQAYLEVRDDDLGYVLKSHSDMRECYTIMSLDEPTGEALEAIVTEGVKTLVNHHRIAAAPGIVTKAIELTNRYATRDPSLSRAQPEKALTLIDRSFSSYRLTAHVRSPEALRLEQEGGDPVEIARLDAEFASHHDELKKLYTTQRDAEIAVIEYEEQIEAQRELEAQKRASGEEVADTAQKSAISSFMNQTANSGYDSQAVRELKAKVDVANSVIADNGRAFNDLAARINASLLLTENHLLMDFSRLSGIPASKLNEDEREKLKLLAESIKQKIWGQDEAVDKLANAIKAARIGRRNKNKPQASFMFLGPSGVGKTEIVKVLSSLLDMELLRFDMSEYMEKNAVNTLIGAPAGYEGYENGGTLTKAMKKNPRQIVLFDEIEKADPAVFNIFLQMLDAGRLTDRFGQTVSFSEAIIIMTSNIGQPELLEGLEMKDGHPTFSVDEQTRHDNALDVLTSTPGIRPEFLNRFNGRQNIVFFNHLEPESIAKIVRRELDDLGRAYEEQGIRVQVTADVIERFTRDRYDVKVGGRGLPGFINANLEPHLTNKVLEDSAFTGTMYVGYSDGQFVPTFEAAK